ncbi:MAG: phosphoribosylaminoimidazole carboxylase, catalytic subunit [Planctomycetaceae bacterium]|nr:phosphoribosylaminoimidazole carboxylase, catalytic subunit [Planctomycetaceae bacterium]
MGLRLPTGDTVPALRAVTPSRRFNGTRQRSLVSHRSFSGPKFMSNDTSQPAAVPLVGIIMGSQSDWETMQHAADILKQFGIPHECRVVSAHRTPVWMQEYATTAESRGLQLIIAGAGGAAHLPGMVAAHTVLPVLGVPVQSHALSGLDSLLSIVQMPGGVPVATLAIGKAGATNAGLLAVSILGTSQPELRAKLHAFRQQQTDKVLDNSWPDAPANVRL